MQFLVLAALVATALGDGGEHHHHQDQYSVPQAAAPVDAYGAPAQADTYGAPQEAPVYSAPTPGYGVPSQEYGAPAQEYGAPAAYAPEEYGAPAEEYGAPQEYAPQEYAAPTGYDAPATGFEAPIAIPDLFDLSKIVELLPLFLAVFAAIIVAQLFAPLLGALFGTKFTILSGLISPLGDAKIGLINTILAMFNLSLCDISNPAAPVVATGRSDKSTGFSMNSDTVDLVAHMLYKAIDNYSP